MIGNNQNNSKKILLTGITGFLGSNLLDALLNEGYSVIGLKRITSNIWRIKEFLNDRRLKVINDDEIELNNLFISEKIDTLIHCAWGGVEAEDRNSFNIQLENFYYSARLFNLAIKGGIKRIISFGSQAEYGKYEGRVDETSPCIPVDAYGTAKVFTKKLLQALAEPSNTKWFWIRIFSLFGPKQNDKWLLPLAINKMLNNLDIDLTKCEQKYDYLYIKDFCRGIILLFNSENSGVYNFSSNNSIQLKEILLLIKNILKSNSNLNFGTLEYKMNQVMQMEGNSSKFYKETNISIAPLRSGLIKTINYYKKK